MSLQTTCENCDTDWPVDQMVYVEAVQINLCPVCINNLVDSLVMTLSSAQWRSIKETF